ncbi:kinase-like protein [Aspergillus heteromorphus CBS 117.55]|uniref:Kinase-like protein n=1 Tax=Aspergillus heteromorphus CBS 117.55 TaxID=1448321 RepID=A0A317WWZ2_9EURO|nr:kinase-like protein [Aspergillus heteromorphus CBS 117.55]PWY90914.1 kinase-like protein [Aspergillus heteromorphus CBS 117.55]
MAITGQKLSQQPIPGGSGRVSIVSERRTNSHTLFAVKELFTDYPTYDKEFHEQQLRAEFIIARRARHPHIVKSLALCRNDEGALCCTMEYCSQGDLFDIKDKGHLTLKDKLCLFKQLLHGVSHLHSCGIAHRDLKLENLLLGNDSLLKIADFGAATVFRDPDMPRHQVRWYADRVGTDVYMAPELFVAEARQRSYDPRPVDVWCCAMVLRCLAAGLGAQDDESGSELQDHGR